MGRPITVPLFSQRDIDNVDEATLHEMAEKTWAVMMLLCTFDSGTLATSFQDLFKYSGFVVVVDVAL